MIVNVHEAKSQLSKLLDAAEQGEDVYVTRRGKRFRIVPALIPDRSLLFGALKDRFPEGWMAQYDSAETEFDDYLDEWLDNPKLAGENPT